MGDNKTVLENIKSQYSKMFAAEKKVADFILENPERAVMMNVSELSRLSGVSDATVIRMCKRIEFDGYYQMKIKLSNDLGKNQLVKLKDGNPQPESVKELFQIFALNMLKIAEGLNVDALLACAELIKNAGTVHIVAAGNTSTIACDLGFRLGRFGIRATYSMVTEYYLYNVSLADEKDIVIAISHSGTSKPVIQALELAKAKKLKSIAITGHEYSPISSMTDYLLLARLDTPVFGEALPDSHISEMAVIDALLYFLVKGKTFGNDIPVEILLSEYKL